MKLHWTGLAFLFALVFVNRATAIPQNISEGTLMGYPELVDPGSHSRVASGEYRQWLEHGDVHIQVDYKFKDGRRGRESVVLSTRPELRQKSFLWSEEKNHKTLRRFEANFQTGHASAFKLDEKQKPETWDETLEIHPDRTFAGIGMSYAIKNLMDRLKRGERITLDAVAFTPKPRVTGVEIFSAGKEAVAAATLKTQAEHIVIHPKVPAIAKLFVKIQDLDLWITELKPYAVLRFRGPLEEPSEPVVQLEIYPPVKKTG